MPTLTPHDALLDKWRASSGQLINFVKDGIIDEGRWVKTNTKVLLLLKEAYSNKVTTGFDQRAVIRDYYKGVKKDNNITWINGALWCYAVQTRSPTMPAAKKSKILDDALLQAAVINVKKSDGKKTSDMKEIKAIAKRDGAFIQEQIAIINPDIVICGNTWTSVEHLYSDRTRIFPRVWFADSRYFINFWHPAYFGHTRRFYYEKLLEFLGEIDAHRTRTAITTI
ncbi:hypothetical protein [Thiofilum flexile]|uniref:hypothetical protein n=1 Tax=Thiofilum flexile TaxID=125627 RepID=UPI000364C1EA|nr:hypothetical protein [Thiofilum flexile]